jgi:hypothetical protein
MISKIQTHHRQKMAYVYLRQSTMAQVYHHQESTQRQYALKGVQGKPVEKTDWIGHAAKASP